MVPKRSDVIKYLNQKGLDPSRLGYNYIEAAIRLASNNPHKPPRVMALVHEVAKKYSTSDSQAHRNMCYALQAANAGVSLKKFVAIAVNYFQAEVLETPAKNKCEKSKDTSSNNSKSTISENEMQRKDIKTVEPPVNEKNFLEKVTSLEERVSKLESQLQRIKDILSE